MRSAVASRSRTYLAAQYRRLATRRGKAGIYGWHTRILIIAYPRHWWQRAISGTEGLNCFDQQRPQATTKRLEKRHEQLGHASLSQLQSSEFIAQQVGTNQVCPVDYSEYQ